VLSFSVNLYKTYGLTVGTNPKKKILVCESLADVFLHLCTCTTHSGDKKSHDWVVDQLVVLFHTMHKVKTQQVIKSRGHHCGDIELAGYLPHTSDPVPLVLDLRVVHDRVDNSSDPALNGHLRNPNNLDQSFNDTTTDKIRRYRVTIVSTSGRFILNLSEFYSYRLTGKLTAFSQLQEFCQRNQIVDSSTTSARLFLLCSNLGLETFSPSLQLYVLILT
jgi:hypothetical protein